MDAFWHGWLWVTFAVPIFYALDCVLDVFFVGKNIYRNAVHATILTGLFYVVFLLALLPLHDQFIKPEFEILVMGIANGVFYLLHIYFYFRALFSLNDASNLECILGFSVLLVPLLAFVFLGQELTNAQYLGISIAAIGVITLAIVSISKGAFLSSLTTLSGAVILLSITFVIQDEVFRHVNFYTGLVLFIAGKIIAAIILWIGSDVKGIIKDTYRHGSLFLFSQFLGVCAVIFLQRAINISPSVTLVAAIETTTPLFIMLFSLLLLFIMSIFKNKDALACSILVLQINKLPYKLFAFTLLLSGIFISSAPQPMSDYLQLSFTLINEQLGVSKLMKNAAF